MIGDKGYLPCGVDQHDIDDNTSCSGDNDIPITTSSDNTVEV